MADTSAADTIAGAPCADVTGVVPEVTQAAAVELAWSVEAGDDDDPAPRSWHSVYRSAIGVFATCIAVAGAITVADQHWHFEPQAVRVPPVAATPTAPSSPVAAEPTVTAADAAPTTLQVAGPTAERLRTPEPVLPPAGNGYATDSAFIAALSRNGVAVYDPDGTVLLARMVCDALASGRSMGSIAWEIKAGQNTSSRGPIDMPTAMYFVAASANYYCPQYH